MIKIKFIFFILIICASTLKIFALPIFDDGTGRHNYFDFIKDYHSALGKGDLDKAYYDLRMIALAAYGSHEQIGVIDNSILDKLAYLKEFLRNEGFYPHDQINSKRQAILDLEDKNKSKKELDSKQGRDFAEYIRKYNKAIANDDFNSAHVYLTDIAMEAYNVDEGEGYPNHYILEKMPYIRDFLKKKGFYPHNKIMEKRKTIDEMMEKAKKKKEREDKERIAKEKQRKQEEIEAEEAKKGHVGKLKELLDEKDELIARQKKLSDEFQACHEEYETLRKKMAIPEEA